MRIAVAGKGGSGKTTVAGTIARAMARSGVEVVALDGDTNPMLGVSVGLGAEETDLILDARAGLESGTVAHQPNVDDIISTFGARGPDGVLLVVVNRIDQIEPDCP
ncbi:MAG: AAA family ATPase [Acidimicrobiia bacterium]|jgi:CO dehydrogenase maturation factor